jgi:hypothetical protein
MKYTKPEVAVLGQASVVIESSIVKTPQFVLDTPQKQLAPSPAYDLDE